MLIFASNFKFVRTHNVTSQAKVAQSSELYQPVSQWVLVTVNRDELVFWTPGFFYFWTAHFSVSTSHFGWTPRLNYMPDVFV